ncbi:MAG: HAMP domain-containing histidine kinase [Clostridiales bacterium]|jgi:histidine kinase|nr:HAMP domain-containing histidine kinase [Clostridiales bacterium]
MSIKKKLLISVAALCAFSSAVIAAALYIEMGVIGQSAEAGALAGLFNAFFIALIIISALMMACLLVAGAVLIKSVVDPLGRLCRMAKEIKDGNLSYQDREPRPAGDEFAFVFSEFDEMRERLAASLAELNAHDDARREMLQNIAHDVKTPLTAINGAAEAIGMGLTVDPEKLARYLGIIRCKTAEVNRLISELADYSRLESGEAPADVSEVGIAEFIRRELADCALNVSVEIPDSLVVLADAGRLGRVIQNIAGNSVKFGASSLQVRSSEGVPGFAVIALSDDGRGAGEEECARMFDRFYRADKARTSPGSGLGLSIAKKIVAASGGNIWARPGEGRGLSIFITFRKVGG